MFPLRNQNILTTNKVVETLNIGLAQRSFGRNPISDQQCPIFNYFQVDKLYKLN